MSTEGHPCSYTHALSPLYVSLKLLFFPSSLHMLGVSCSLRPGEGPRCQPVCIGLSVGGIVCFAAPLLALCFIDLPLHYFQGKGRVH